MSTDLNNLIIGTAINNQGAEETRILKANSSTVVSVPQGSGTISPEDKWTIDSDAASPNLIRIKSEMYLKCLGKGASPISVASLQTCQSNFPLEKEFPSTPTGEFFIKTSGAQPLYLTIKSMPGNATIIRFEQKATTAQGLKTQKWKFSKTTDR